MPQVQRLKTKHADWRLHGLSPEKFEAREEIALEHLRLAIEASQAAYAPYSKFKVGASLLAFNSDGEKDAFRGCNVENASYGATMCAERVAVFSAVSAGFGKIGLIALSTQNSASHPDLRDRSPCGLCRQVISEFADEETVVVIDGGKDKNGLQAADVTGIDRLLPWRFRLSDPIEEGTIDH